MGNLIISFGDEPVPLRWRQGCSSMSSLIWVRASFYNAKGISRLEEMKKDHKQR